MLEWLVFHPPLSMAVLQNTRVLKFREVRIDESTVSLVAGVDLRLKRANRQSVQSPLSEHSFEGLSEATVQRERSLNDLEC